MPGISLRMKIFQAEKVEKDLILYKRNIYYE